MKQNIPFKLGWFISHPIQYQVPLFREIARQPDIEFCVYYYSRMGLASFFDPQFGKKIKWDIPLVEGYKSVFFKNNAIKEGFHFWGFLNFSLWQVLQKGHFDAVLVNGWSYASDWFLIFIALLRDIPIFLRAESPLHQEISKNRFKLFLRRIILGRILFPRIKAFLYIGKHNREFYEYYGVPQNKLFFVPYAVDNKFFAGKMFNGRKMEKADDFSVLFVGKLIPKKRPLDLIKAYEIVCKKRNSSRSISLVFVGEGYLRENLERYIRERNIFGVRFVGFKNQNELPDYYAAADIFVLPSGEGETWGLVVNEAMCFGLPVIVSNQVGCGADLVMSHQNGYIYPAGDYRSLARHLLLLVNNRGKREFFSRKSKEIISMYNYEADIEGIREAFRTTASL